MKKNILIYGAGAIGRGYIPWLFVNEDVDISFVENNEKLLKLLVKNKKYISYKTKNNKFEKLNCFFKECLKPGEESPNNYDAIITAVGPRQVFSLAEKFKNANCPIIMFENDSTIPEKFRSITGKDNFYFGVPDVITSNTATSDFIENDPLSIITEDGVCFAESGASSMGGDIRYVSSEELRKQWLAKLYIHNTPHCIAAYLGFIKNKVYLHEGMEDKNIFNIVEGAMLEMNQTITKLYNLDEDFTNWYSKKELQRFANVLLHDPISRVAREPFRKLGLHDRLIGAAQLSLSVGVLPKNLILGIMAAFLYDDPKDDDYHISILLNSLTKQQFLDVIIKIQPHEALYKIMIDSWESSIEILKEIKNSE